MTAQHELVVHTSVCTSTKVMKGKQYTHLFSQAGASSKAYATDV